MTDGGFTVRFLNFEVPDGALPFFVKSVKNQANFQVIQVLSGVEKVA
jgi:hypothetical protein